MHELAAGLSGGKKFMNKKGIFLTFMSFLLVSTLLALSISISQAGIGAGKNLAEDTAFKTVNNAFNSMEQQAVIAKEGYAGAAYSRIMPFKKFRAEDNWIEIEQDIVDSGGYLKNTYDALNLFSIFAQEKGPEGLQVNVTEVIQDNTWGGENQYPELAYIVLPQCLKFSAGGDAGASTIAFKDGTIGDGCLQDFDPASIKSWKFEISFGYSDYDELKCNGAFKSGSNCTGPNGGDQAQPNYAEVTITLDGCGPPCSESEFELDGTKTISGNLSGMPNDYIHVDLEGQESFKLEFSNYLVPITSNQDRTKSFSTKIVFKEPFDEIALAKNQFEFGIKNTGFGVCRATSEAGC